MKETRLRKVKDFEKFYDSSESLFTDIRDNDKRVEIFQREYMLIISPGSRAGGDEKRVVEIFWGARPYEYITKGNHWRSLTETGVTLFFYRNDTGDVTISLYPAKTEYRKPVEDYITLHELIDPKRLHSKRFIRSLWNDFIAYMEFTSLDGKPTFQQKLRIFYLKHFKHMVVNQTWMPTRFSEFSKEVFKWVLTGGIIFYVIPILTEPKYSETDLQLIEINKKLEKISTRRVPVSFGGVKVSPEKNKKIKKNI